MNYIPKIHHVEYQQKKVAKDTQITSERKRTLELHGDICMFKKTIFRNGLRSWLSNQPKALPYQIDNVDNML